MSEFFSCWIFQPELFSTFFQKHAAARKLLAAALTGLSPKRLLSAVWYPGSTFPDGFCLRVRMDSGEFFILEIIPLFSVPASPASDSPFFPFLSTEDSFFSSPKPGFPGNFLRIFLTFQEPDQKNPFFYGNFRSPDLPFSCRICNLGSLQPSVPGFPQLYSFARLLLIRQASELSSLVQSFPWLIPASSFLEDLLREQEIKALFEESPLFSPEDSRGISAMCSVNRFLIREKRFDDLQKISDDPDALRQLFQEFREKGFFACEKDPCRLHRSQEKREKYI